MKIYPILLILTVVHCSDLQPLQQVDTVQQSQQLSPAVQQMASAMNGVPTEDMKKNLMSQIKGSPMDQLKGAQEQLKTGQEQLKQANGAFTSVTSKIDDVKGIAKSIENAQTIITEPAKQIDKLTSGVVNSLTGTTGTSNTATDIVSSDVVNTQQQTPPISVANTQQLPVKEESTPNTVAPVDQIETVKQQQHQPLQTPQPQLQQQQQPQPQPQAQTQQPITQKQAELLIPNPKVTQQQQQPSEGGGQLLRQERKISPLQALPLGPILPWSFFPTDRMNALLSVKQMPQSAAWPWKEQSIYNEAHLPISSPFLYYLYSLKKPGTTKEQLLKAVLKNIGTTPRTLLSITPPNPIVQEIDSVPMYQKPWNVFNEELVKDHIIQILQGRTPITVTSVDNGGVGTPRNLPYHRMMAYELLLTIQMADMIDLSLIKAGLTIQDRDLVILASKMGLHHLLGVLLGQNPPLPPPPPQQKGTDSGAPTDLQFTELQTLLMSAQFQPHSMLRIISMIPWEQREVVKRANEGMTMSRSATTAADLLKMWLKIPDVALVPKGKSLCDGATSGVKEFRLPEDLLPSTPRSSTEEAQLLGKAFAKWNFGIPFEQSEEALSLVIGQQDIEKMIPRAVANGIMRGYCMPKPVVLFT